LFISRAACYTRTLVTFWSIGQLLAVAAFLLGLKLRVQYLLAPHLIMDVLIMLIVFICGLTLAALSLILLTLSNKFTFVHNGSLLLASTTLHCACGFYAYLFAKTLYRIEISFENGLRRIFSCSGDKEREYITATFI